MGGKISRTQRYVRGDFFKRLEVVQSLSRNDVKRTVVLPVHIKEVRAVDTQSQPTADL